MHQKQAPPSCTLCGAEDILQKALVVAPAPGGADQEIAYFTCAQCDLVFQDPDKHLSMSMEFERYQTHNNDPADQGYRNFLRPAMDLAAEKFDRAAPLKVLDFGCGHGRPFSTYCPPLWDVTSYDLHFFPQALVGHTPGEFQLIFCTEVVEHFRNPNAGWGELDGWLGSGGELIVMTGVLSEAIDFKSWWYMRDPTHVCFYSEDTFKFIGEKMGWSYRAAGKNLVSFSKP